MRTLRRTVAIAAFALVAASCGSPIFSPFGEVQGEVCDARGRPLAGVVVDVEGMHTRTDGDGHFRAREVPPGVTAVTVEGHRHVEVDVPEHDIGVVFDDACRAGARDAPPFAAWGA